MSGATGLPRKKHRQLQFEANLRALVEAHRLEDGKLRLRCPAEIAFLMLPTHVIGVEREEED